MIEKYLVSTCLFVIDEMNERFEGVTNDKLKDVADSFTEADLVVRLGYPFKSMANFSTGKGADILLKTKTRDFEIQVKYLKNYDSEKGTRSNKSNWKALQKDFDWLTSQIIEGNKNNRAIVLGWFTGNERFSQIAQLGKGTGRYPLIDETKKKYFPFLNPSSSRVTDISYQYSDAYNIQSIHIPGHTETGINCMFLGSKTDKFHFAIYW